MRLPSFQLALMLRGDPCEPAYGLHAVHVANMPFEVVEGAHHLVVDAAVLHGFGDHRQHVHADLESVGDHGGVEVVHGVGPQLRNAPVLVAHPDVRSEPCSGRQHHHRHADHHRGRSAARQARDPRPHRLQQGVALPGGATLLVVRLEVREQYR